jgi:hypothetical protein
MERKRESADRAKRRRVEKSVQEIIQELEVDHVNQDVRGCPSPHLGPELIDVEEAQKLQQDLLPNNASQSCSKLPSKLIVEENIEISGRNSFSGDSDCDTVNEDDYQRLGWNSAEDILFENELEIKSVYEAEDEEVTSVSLSDLEQSDEKGITEELANWATSFQISLIALGALLLILRKYDFPLPKDPRTVLHTPKNIVLQQIKNGFYYHFGIKRALQNILMKAGNLIAVNNVTQLKVLYNIDGIPLFKSANLSLWPILCKIKNLPHVFPVGVFCGNSKPGNIHEYLREFVTEQAQLQDACISINGSQFSIMIEAIVCDAPARAFIKCVKNHSGYHSCERCKQKGVWHSKVTLPELDAPARTDRNFRKMKDMNHHIEPSPLLALNMGLVTQFPLDYMHSVCLGVVRRMLFLWTRGPLNCRLSARHILVISNQLESFKSFFPSNFSRKPRSLTDLKMWKATEFRQFLLYCGPIALKSILSTKYYNNFLSLSVAMTILLSPDLCLYISYANDLLRYFVKNFGKLYGENQLVYNVHCLTHLAEDAQRFGPLDNAACFPFENYLGHLKRLIKSPKNPLMQIVHRLSEKENMFCDSASVYWNEGNSISLEGKQYIFRKEHVDGPTPVGYETWQQYRQMTICDSCFLSINNSDNYFMINNKIFIVKNILVHNKERSIRIVASQFQCMSSFFEQPLMSQDIGIFCLKQLSDGIHIFDVKNLQKKYVVLPCNAYHVGFPLLHWNNNCY